MKNYLAVVCLLVIVGFCSLCSQDRNARIEAARHKIESLLLDFQNGAYHTVGEIVDVDSSIADSGIAFGNITDPYGTLKHSFLFLGQTKSPAFFVVGIYRMEHIIWLSDSLEGDQYSDIGATFVATKDINKGGKVDILLSWQYGPNLESSDMWIFSWDGTRGVCINDREDDDMGSTRLHSYSSGFAGVVDIDGDGIFEILGGSEQGKNDIVYSWNGQKYGAWENTPNIGGDTFTKGNKLSARLHASADQKRGMIAYSFLASNGLSSAQKIASLYITTTIDTVLLTRSPRKWNAGFDAEHKLISFGTDDEFGMIQPGGTSGTFSILSRGIPRIAAFYIQGPVNALNTSDDPSQFEQQFYENIYLNSFSGSTIAPAKPPSAYEPIEFLDTLLSYVHQSHELGWINNTRDDDAEADERAEDGIVKNLDKRLRQTRDLIVKDKIGAAKGRLTMFLNKVERLWDRQQKEDKRNRRNPKIIFTSEAYALLKYNGEYLLDHLTEPKEGKDGKDKGREEKKGREK
jgi:hypothetical protein